MKEIKVGQIWSDGHSEAMIEEVSAIHVAGSYFESATQSKGGFSDPIKSFRKSWKFVSDNGLERMKQEFIAKHPSASPALLALLEK